jgi:hypothetical protein
MVQRKIVNCDIINKPTIFTLVLVMTLSAFADSTNLFENFSPHFSTNTEILWKAPTNHLPQSFWVYKRYLPRIFSETVISNAIVLASLQRKGFPKSSTNDFYIHEDFTPNGPGMVPEYFGILPNDAYLYYTAPSPDHAAIDIPNNTILVAEAFKHARDFGLNSTDLIQKNFFTDLCNTNLHQQLPPDGVIGRGVFLSRQLNGITFFSPDDQGSGAEGFLLELGGEGKIQAFFLRYSDIKPYRNVSIARPDQIIQCIRTQKIIVLPDPNDEWYFEKIKKLATARKFTITQITAYYVDNTFGETPTWDAPSQFISPIAELDAVADFGNSNMTIHIYAPITSSDVGRLLGK